jgi:hypothetical protein
VSVWNLNGWINPELGVAVAAMAPFAAIGVWRAPKPPPRTDPPPSCTSPRETP